MLYKAGVTEEYSLYKMGVYKCDVCAKVFTEKNSLSRHEKKAVMHVICATKFTASEAFA